MIRINQNSLSFTKPVYRTINYNFSFFFFFVYSHCLLLSILLIAVFSSLIANQAKKFLCKCLILLNVPAHVNKKVTLPLNSVRKEREKDELMVGFGI